MNSSWKCVDLQRHERLKGISSGTKDLEAKKDYFLRRAKESQDQIEANNFRKIAKIIDLAMQVNAERIYLRIDYADVKQPALYISFEFKGFDEVSEFGRLIRKTEF